MNSQAPSLTEPERLPRCASRESASAVDSGTKVARLVICGRQGFTVI
jgi:hypothetical protein